MFSHMGSLFVSWNSIFYDKKTTENKETNVKKVLNWKWPHRGNLLVSLYKSHENNVMLLKSVFLTFFNLHLNFWVILTAKWKKVSRSLSVIPLEQASSSLFRFEAKVTHRHPVQNFSTFVSGFAMRCFTSIYSLHKNSHAWPRVTENRELKMNLNLILNLNLNSNSIRF